MKERKYFVKMNDRFNLESMYEKLWCLLYEMKTDDKVEIMGKQMTPDDVTEFRHEVETLLGHALFGKVTGKEYGRIKEISKARQYMRYCTCIAAGMKESDAALSFTD